MITHSTIYSTENNDFAKSNRDANKNRVSVFSIAMQLAAGLKNGKQLKLVDQHLKALDVQCIQSVINLANEQLTNESTRLRIELRSYSAAISNLQFFELTLKENGKLVALDSWSKAVVHRFGLNA